MLNPLSRPSSEGGSGIFASARSAGPLVMPTVNYRDKSQIAELRVTIELMRMNRQQVTSMMNRGFHCENRFS